MPFPSSPRVVYATSPLNEVVAKLVFPPILRIESQLPADFQELVRAEFPRYTLCPAQPAPAPQGGTQTAQALVGGPLVPPGVQSFVFESADRLWRLVLTRDRLALATTRYDRWEGFRAKLDGPLDALRRVYRPASLTHVCVRYQNLIRREALGLRHTPWGELVRPWAAGPLAAPDIVGDARSLLVRFLIDLPGQLGQVDAACGLGIEEPSKRPLFFIESHTFSNLKTDPADALARLDELHEHARAFFRWCITDRLHGALGPRPVAGG